MDTKRRQINEAFATLAKFGLVSGTGVISALPIIAPETYLNQCRATINLCRSQLDSGKYAQVQDTLYEYLPTLTLMATVPTEYSQQASLLTTQAKLLQMRIANRNLDYITREFLLSEAVHFAELSGNTRLQVTALYWQGDTFKYCYRQPERAIPIFTKALQIAGNDMRLNRSKLLISLSIAHAQKGEKDESVEFALRAQKVMPKHPELDPFFQDIELNQSVLDQLEGKSRLYLAETFPEYAEQAYDLFGKSTSNQVPHYQGYRCQALIDQADATIIIDSLPKFVEHLTEGVSIGVQLGNKRKLNEAQDVLSRIPERWQNKTPILKLKKDLALARAL